MTSLKDELTADSGIYLNYYIVKHISANEVHHKSPGSTASAIALNHDFTLPSNCKNYLQQPNTKIAEGFSPVI